MTPDPTAAHTLGPFFHEGVAWLATPATAADDTVEIGGTIVDAAGEPLPAWFLEVWAPQDVAREAARPAPGLQRHTNGADAAFSFRVGRPSPGEPAAYLVLGGTGLTRCHYTAVFLPDAGPSALLAQVPDSRRATLVAEGVAPGRYRWTVRTQGEGETVFFDYA